MDTDKSKWGEAEWRTYAQKLQVAYQEALDGWGKTVSELESHSMALDAARTEVLRLQSMLSLAMQALKMAGERASSKPVKRGPGRPSKHQADDLTLLHAFEDMKREFEQAHPGRRATDGSVLTWYFERVFEGYGLRASRAQGLDFQKKLKNFKNRISDMRNPVRRR